MAGVTVGAMVSIRNARVVVARLPAASVAANVTVWLPSRSTTTVEAVSALAGLPSRLTDLPATPEVASAKAGLSVTGPRHVDAASPALPASDTPMVGGRVSILKVRWRQASRTPALSVAR